MVRARLGFHRPTLLSVGNLVDIKGHDLVIASLARLPEWQLVIVGRGESLAGLTALAQKLGVADRVRFVGEMDQSTLRDYYGAADALVLGSKSEGVANVIMESLACGTPVLATRVGGTPEVICDRVAGLLIEDRSAASVAASVRRLFEDMPARDAVRTYAERFSWSATAQQDLELIRSVVDSRGTETDSRARQSEARSRERVING
jgi:teichuronic acid biosynthesis glycosyltransferase TuaC